MGAGIVYCFSRNECEKVAAELQHALRTEHGLNHGQRRAEVRHAPSCLATQVLPHPAYVVTTMALIGLQALSRGAEAC